MLFINFNILSLSNACWELARTGFGKFFHVFNAVEVTNSCTKDQNVFPKKKKKKKFLIEYCWVLIIYFTQVRYDARCLHHNFRFILMQDRECNCMPVRNDKVWNSNVSTNIYIICYKYTPPQKKRVFKCIIKFMNSINILRRKKSIKNNIAKLRKLLNTRNILKSDAVYHMALYLYLCQYLMVRFIVSISEYIIYCLDNIQYILVKCKFYCIFFLQFLKWKRI